jgi:hypothetical protein
MHIDDSLLDTDPASASVPGHDSAPTTPEITADRSNAEAFGAELADELDVIFQRSLDLLETQLEQAEAIEKDLHDGLKLEGTSPLLGINPERSINPQGVYRVLADRLIQAVRPRLDPLGKRASVLFMDLIEIEWRDEPLRLGLSLTEYLLRKVRFARGKSLRDLHQHILLRLTPESMPEDAATTACQELILTLCVEVPPALVIPMKDVPPITVLYMVLGRKEGDLQFHLTAYQLDRIAQSLLAFAQLAALDGNNAIATEMNEAANSLRERFKRSKNLYEDREKITAGSALKLILRKDTIEFHVDVSLMTLFRTQALENMNRLEFIRQ